MSGSVYRFFADITLSLELDKPHTFRWRNSQCVQVQIEIQKCWTRCIPHLGAGKIMIVSYVKLQCNLQILMSDQTSRGSD